MVNERLGFLQSSPLSLARRADAFQYGRRDGTTDDWFLRGRGFGSIQQLKRAPLKLAGFIALWVAYITPKVRWLGEEFQSAAGDGQGAAAGKPD